MHTYVYLYMCFAIWGFLGANNSGMYHKHGQCFVSLGLRRFIKLGFLRHFRLLFLQT